MSLALPFSRRPAVTYPRPPFDASINDVIDVCSKEVVSRVAARRVIALMQNLQSCRDGALSQYPSDAVCKPLSIKGLRPAEATVSRSLPAAHPRPARIGATATIYRRPELVGKLARIVAGIERRQTFAASLVNAAERAVGSEHRIKGISRQFAIALDASTHCLLLPVVVGRVRHMLAANMAQIVPCALGDRCDLAATAATQSNGIGAILGTHFADLLNRSVGCRARGGSSRARVFACLNYTAIRHEMAVSA